MAIVTIYDADKDDKELFTEQLKGHTLNFSRAPIDLHKIDPATEVLSVFINTPVTKEVMSALPNLRLIATRSTGVNHIDHRSATEKKITIANVPSYGGTTVAEYTFTLLLMLTRHMSQVIHETSATEPNRKKERGMDLFGKTLGIIGTGSIGQGVARIAKGFGMRVIGFDVYPNEKAAKEIGFTYVKDVRDALTSSDIVSLHIPYTTENHHFLNKERLELLKPGAIVVNTARGELIDTTALVHALTEHRISAAALDVLESEYLLDPDEVIALATHSTAAKLTLRHAVSLAALQHMPNVLITNHNAFNTKEAIARLNQVTAENITNFLAGKELHSI